MPRDFVDEDLGVAAVAAPRLPVQAFAPATDDVLRVLIEARELIEKPENWHKGSCFSDDKESMCAQGAIARVWLAARDDRGYIGIWHFLDRFVPAGRLASIYNDHPTTTHADVLALFDRAIAARRAELAS